MVIGGVEGQGRHLHACSPSTAAQAKIDQATANAIGGSLAVALSEVTDCASQDPLGNEERAPLAISLSLAISEGVDVVKEECGGDVEAAAEAVAASVVQEVQNEVAKVNPEAEDRFASRSADLLLVVSNELEARSVDILEETTQDRATIIADRILQALQDILFDLNCGTDTAQRGSGGLQTTTPSKPKKKKRCRWIAGRRVGADC